MAVRTSLMEFQIPRIVHEEVEDNRGVFVIEPLDRGFGYTFGNSLRRVLLSSLEGAAVTSVKIEGVAHEFTTLPGVREDVTDILLNFKNLICRLHGESPEIEVRLSKKGAGVVKASDIEAPAELEILNPDLEIANLSDKGKLEVTLTIGRGRGYVPAELNRGPEHTIGVIPIDSIFSPVRRVSYDVEAARVGQRTDYDKLAHRRHHRRLDRPARVDRPGRGDPDPPACDLHRPRPDRGLRRAGCRGGAGRAGARARDGELPDRGARARACAPTTASSASASRRSATWSRRRRTSSPRSRTSARSRSKRSRRRSRPTGSPCAARTAPRRVRHRRSGRKLGRDASHRKALYANLTGALIEHGRIKTTAAKAKEVKPIAEQMITLGRRGGVHARRQALAFLRSQDVVHKLFSDVGPRFADRPGGYSRIIRIGPRLGDAAEMVYLELVDFRPRPRSSGPLAAEREEEPVEAEAVSAARPSERGADAGDHERRRASRRRASATKLVSEEAPAQRRRA